MPTLQFSETFKDQFESPIEAMFAEAWIRIIEEMHRELIWFDPSDCLKEIQELPEKTPATMLLRRTTHWLMSQCKIGKYRADFVIGRAEFQEGLEHGSTPFILKLPLVVVECDGHDFHERTKEQARHDKERDRLMTSEGFRVMRFTGSEIHRDARRCANEVDLLFFKMLQV